MPGAAVLCMASGRPIVKYLHALVGCAWDNGLIRPCHEPLSVCGHVCMMWLAGALTAPSCFVALLLIPFVALLWGTCVRNFSLL